MRSNRNKLLVLSALIGFISLLFQTIGFQIVFLYFINGHKAVGISTSSFLLGIALSSLLFSRIITHKNAFSILSGLQLINIIYAFVVLMNFDSIPELIQFSKSPILEVFVFWIFLFIPAFLLGGSFPVLNGIFLNDLEKGISDTAKVYFFDTLGAAIGSIVAGFYLLPQLGIDGTLYAGIFFNFIFLILISIFLKRKVQTVVCTILLVICANSVIYFKKPAPQGSNLPIDKRFGKVLFQENSDYGVVTVGFHEKAEGKQENTKVIYINYRQMCSETTDAPEDIKYMPSSLMSLETGNNLLFSKSRVLNIGLGCGMTAKYLSEHPNISELDIVEINPIIFKAADLHFSKENGEVTKKNNVNIYIENGVDYIDRTEKLYGAIVVDVEEVSVIYSSALFTVEYMEKMKSKLTPGGVFTLWSFNVGPEFSRVLKNSASKVFKHVTVQYFSNAINLYASDRELKISKIGSNQDYAGAVDRLKLDEVNTLGNRALEKYYNSNKNFDLPTNYKEKFVRE
jgi:spermidine synthase